MQASVRWVACVGGRSLVLVSGKLQLRTRGSWEEELSEYLVWGNLKRRRERKAKPGGGWLYSPPPPGRRLTFLGGCCGPQALPLSPDLKLLTSFLKGRVLSVLKVRMNGS